MARTELDITQVRGLETDLANIENEIANIGSSTSGYSGYSGTNGIIGSNGISGYSGIDNTSHFPVDVQRYGFINAIGETSISFDPITYTFTLTDLGSGWEYYRTG